MGCLFGCFGSSKDRKRRKRRNNGSPRHQRNGVQIPLQTVVPSVLGITEKATSLVPELGETSEEQLSSSTRKRLTFDSNVKTHAHVTVIGSTDSLLENKENNSEGEKEEGLAKSGQPHTNAKDDSTTSNVGSYPQNHRYQNCRDSDDGAVESVYEGSLSTRKRVTFDSNVKTYEHVTVFESADSILENNNNNSEREKEEGLAKSRQSHTNSEDDSTTSSVGSYPWNYRYQNCRDSDDEAVESEYEESDLDDEDDEFDDGSLLCQEVWSETIPTASMESRTEISLPRVASEEVDSPMTCCGLPGQEGKTIRLNQNIRNRSDYVHPVLNAVENLSQRKAVKSKGTSPLKPQQKENSAAEEELPRISFNSEPRFKRLSFSFNTQSHHQAKNLNKDVAVDASLSNWLVSSETTPKKKISSTERGTITSEKSLSQGSTSVMSIEDRPILGALTLEELKQFSASSLPRKSPSRSPDEMPIIGTVGTYWNHTGETSGSASSYKTKASGSASSYKGIPNTTSKYREDKKVNWHSTPFETRLERALNSGAA